MNPWITLGTTNIPASDKQLTLYHRADEFSIRISGVQGDLMNSRQHGSEEALAQLGCKPFATLADAQVLIGGLGMGFTLAAALNAVPATAHITVAELIPAVVEWNGGPLGDCAGHPLRDPRVQIHLGDVADLLGDNRPLFHTILLDVDNGPEGITHADNTWLYSLDGLAAIYQTLHPEGMLAVWSAGPDQMFLIRLKKAGFNVTAQTVRARPGKGSRHTIFLAQKPLRSRRRR
jgi:spermidine synthase